MSSQNVDIGNNITGGGVDYVSGPYTVTFPVGQSSVSFDVLINNDNLLEDDEIFTLTIMQNTLPNRVSRGSTSQATVTIVNNDGK